MAHQKLTDPDLLPLEQMKAAAGFNLPEGWEIVKPVFQRGLALLGLGMLRQPGAERQEPGRTGMMERPGADAFYRFLMRNVEKGLICGLEASLIEGMMDTVLKLLPDRYEKAFLAALIGTNSAETAGLYLDRFLPGPETEPVLFRIPELPEVRTLHDLLQSESVRKFITNEQIEQFEKASSELIKRSKHPEQDHTRGTYRGRQAIYYSGPGHGKFCTALQAGPFILYSDLMLEAERLSGSGSSGNADRIFAFLDALLRHLEDY